MITNNARKFLGFSLAKPMTTRSVINLGEFAFTDYNGIVRSSNGKNSANDDDVTYHILFPNLYKDGFTPNLSMNDVTLCIGTGDTPASEDDINLDSIVSTGFNCESFAKFVHFVNGKSINTLSRTLTYTGTEDVVIKEVGAFRGFTSSPSGPIFACLMARDVLESPITFHPGDTKTISMQIII